ncbi:5-oxoprolinase subunit PxpA [Psychrosphaera sp.]|nr:5-oxoprolinase subunit PxpA [Psychrosphaera sp.]
MTNHFNNQPLLLNCDLGETDLITSDSIEHIVMPHIDMANIACGGHAGNKEVMATTMKLAIKYKVEIGAHPSYPDRDNFGRKSLNISDLELFDSLLFQLSEFLSVAKNLGVSPSYVKPHGALYNDLAKSKLLCKTVMSVINEVNQTASDQYLKLMVLSSVPNFVLEFAKQFNITLIFEAFADRQYLPDGNLMPRAGNPNAVLDFLPSLHQVHFISQHQAVINSEGSLTNINAASICVHGDNQVAARQIELIKDSLNSNIYIDFVSPYEFTFRSKSPDNDFQWLQNYLLSNFQRLILNVTLASTSLLIKTKSDEIGVTKLIKESLRTLKNPLTEHQNQKMNTITLPIYYGEEVGLDLHTIAKELDLSEEETIKLHLNSHYSVKAIGFAPGFAYLNGLPNELCLPRLKQPRTSVPKGSVAIAESMTAIYPQSSPGGWRIIGNCPLPLFDIHKPDKPLLYSVGDTVRFRQIDKQEFESIKAGSEKVNPKTNATSANPTLQVIKSGPLTTIQDMGRFNVGQYGITQSGVMDTYAAGWANRLLGNKARDAVLEITLGNFEFISLVDCLICVTGATVKLTINGAEQPLWKVIVLNKNDKVTLSFAVSGLRAYMAIQGGFNANTFWGSASTCVRESIGTIIKDKSILSANQYSAKSNNIEDINNLKKLHERALAPRFIPQYSTDITLTFKLGAQFKLFEECYPSGLAAIENMNFVVSPHSDRMGVRLETKTNDLSHDISIESEGISFGAIQIPPNGRPVIMMADRQTLGGYPKVGHLTPESCSKVAQARPGTRVTLVFTTKD